MIIYIDVLLVYDVLINVLMILIINYSFKDKTKLINLLFSSVLSAVILILSIYNKEIMNVLKITGGFLISIFTFSNYKLSRYHLKENKILVLEKMLKVISYYIFNFTFVGLIHIFKIRSWYMLFMIFFILIIIMTFISLKKYVIFVKESEYSVIVKIGINYCKFKGFLDTGNKSNFKGIPIVYINEKYKEKLLHNNLNVIHQNIIVNTVNGICHLQGIIPDKFMINIKDLKKTRKVIICFVGINEECLLNTLLFV